MRAALTALAIGVVGCGDTGKSSERAAPNGLLPDTFRVAFETTRGRFVVAAYRPWAPLAVQRFHGLASTGAFDDNAFFRVVPKFIVQFGVPGDTKLNARLDSAMLTDEPRREQNLRGTVAFAQNGPGTRSHQLFVNLSDNAHLDRQNFVPIGRVVEGMGVVDSIYAAYREKPDFHLIATLGNKYLQRMFPKLDYIATARIVP